MRILLFIFVISIPLMAQATKSNPKTKSGKETEFKVQADQFADLSVLRYRIPGFEQLSLQQKELLYYLSEAAYSGRDIFWDQNYRFNLMVRKTLEAIVTSYKGDRKDKRFAKFMEYAKRVWFSNGIHHHYGNDKILPEINQEYFKELCKNSDSKLFPLEMPYTTLNDLLMFVTPVIFDPNVAPTRQNSKEGQDLVATSANNYYEFITQKEAEEFYNQMVDPNDKRPPMYGLNSRLSKMGNMIKEKVWKVGGLYSPAIEKIVYWLEKAVTVAENEKQAAALKKLIEYYKTGDLRKFDEYNILWVQDTASVVDATNGFIETYGDPLGKKASYESVVSFKDKEATKRIAAISAQAQWFEDNSPISKEYKKKNVVGISAKVITVVAEAGDASPATPIGINLPNSNWIRKEHGSKSVNLGNIVHAYNLASSAGTLKEFTFNNEELTRADLYGALADDLHTDMHEVIGHASGQLKPGVGTPRESLKNYASTIEEARADLVALYYILDKKLVEIGVMPSLEVGKAAYDKYIRNGLMQQLNRIKPGDNIEEAHMRNRQLIAAWVYEKGKAAKIIEKVTKNKKTYFVIRNYEKLRELFGQLLAETQRISSEGDFAAAKALVENYGVKVDKALHAEVLARYKKLNVAPYKGFINPELVPVMENGKIVDVKVEYPDDFVKQMLDYGRKYSFLSVFND